MPPAAPPDVPVDSIVELLAALVRTPSRPGVDDLGPVAVVMQRWFDACGLPWQRLAGPAGEPLGLYAEVSGRPGGPWIVLDATLDTAGFGDESTWSHPPAGAVVADGWLHGRGAADSKSGAALFAHLLQAFARRGGERFTGRLGVLFDLDEHSGAFGGARAFFEPAAGVAPRPDVVMIGYPGDDAVYCGGRGFLRARIAVPGIAAHSGSAEGHGLNAIERALALGQALAAAPLPAAGAGFPLPPKLTLTGVEGGGPGFSQVPDRCELRLDIRLTPAFDAAAARALVERVVREQDVPHAEAGAARIEWIPGWPAYRVPDEHPLVRALRDGARRVTGQDLPRALAGPSNIGNYLASLGVPALCGFGLRCAGVHAADERVELASIAPVYRIYREALQALLAATPR